MIYKFDRRFVSDILNYVTVESLTWVPIFWRKLLPIFSQHKMIMWTKNVPKRWQPHARLQTT